MSATLRMKAMTKDINPHWDAIGPLLTIHTQKDYKAAIERMNNLLDEIGNNEKHPLYELLDTLDILIEAYEKDHFAFEETSGVENLRFLMNEHALTQSDLPEIGSQGVVSEIMNGKRELNIRQIRQLAQRFHVESGVFIC